MSIRQWMPFYPDDFLLDTADLDVAERGAYVILLMITWQRDGALPNDMVWLKAALKMHAKMHGLQFNRIVPKLLKRYFHLGPDDKWRNGRLWRELEKAREIVENGKRNANKRWSRTRNINGLGYATPMPIQYKDRKKEVAEKERGKESSKTLAEIVKAKGWVQ